MKRAAKMNPGEKRLRFAQLRKRDGDVCWLCGEPIDFSLPRPADARLDPGAPTLDHVIPRWKGGSNKVSNLKLAHFACNNRRGYLENPEVVARRAA